MPRVNDTSTTGLANGTFAAHIEGDEVRDGVKGFVFELVLYALVHRLGLQDQLKF